jgi:hypothetical protein
MSPDNSGALVRAALHLQPLSASARNCQTIYLAAFQDALAQGQKPGEARSHAAAAYRLAMPVLTDRQAIHDAIACTAQGLVLRVFTGQEASALLYAAQVAISLIRQEEKPCPKPVGRPRKTA